MSRDLLDLVRELNTLNDDNLADRVIENNDVQWCLSELQDILEEMPTLTPPNEPLTLEQLREMEDPVWCVCKTVEGFEGFWCLCNHGYILTPARQIFDVKEIPHWVFYRRPPEGEE